MLKLLTYLMLFCAAAMSLGCQGGTKDVQKPNIHEAKSSKPNFLLIVADDLGFSDLGAFGGEIDTPNLDALAMSGIRFTSFYTAPTCSPTRSMLLTGKDSHTVGLGTMEEVLPLFPQLQGKPGYEGYLNTNSVTIAEVFSLAGYRTMMTGKWHLGRAPEQQPSEHGFDQSFVLVQGGGDHFGMGQNGSKAIFPVTYTENGKPVTYPIGQYSSDFYAGKMIEYMTTSASDDRPFFAYLAFTAPHWPLQAPKDLIAKYEGKYDTGPAAKRTARLKRMQEIDLLDETTLAANLTPIDNWDELSREQRAISARTMEIYAAMVDSLDQNIGRILNHLRATGELENTVIIFMSDNGAAGMEANPLMQAARQFAEIEPEYFESVKSASIDLNKMGGPDTFLAYGPQWARAAMAPFREFKSVTEEGGIKSPAFIVGPGITGGRIVDGPLSVRDVMPTVMDIAAIPRNDSKNEKSNVPRGISWMPILRGSAETVRDESEPLAWELFGRRGVRMGDWKAVYGVVGETNFLNRQGQASWRLYDLRADPGETTDVKSDHPEVFEKLMEAWDNYAEENGVVALDELD